MTTIHGKTRRLPLLATILAAFAAGSCDGNGVSGPPQSTALALTITAAAGVSADQGRLQIEGAARRTVTLQPGETREVELPAGSYNIALEGLTGGVVTSYFQRNNVTVTEGRLTSITATLSTFAGVAPTTASNATAGQPVTVSWSPVSGADSYDVEASLSESFSPLLAGQMVSGTSTQFTFEQTGVVFFRVRPRTRFNGAGQFSPASAGTQIRERVQSVEISPPSGSVEIGQTLALTATTRGPNNELLTGRTVEWSSNNTAVATVDGSGVVTGRSIGSATIQASSEGASAVAVILVVDAAVASVTVEPVSVTVALNGTADFVATARNGAGTIIPGAQFTWSSDDETVATVDGTGRATGVGGGVANIIATADGISGSGAMTVSAGVPPQVTSYEVVFAPINQACGVFQDFRTDERLTYTDADGNMNPFQSFVEPTSGPPQGIDSQFREEGATDWKEFGYQKQWDDEPGASGSSGGLDAVGTSCWDFTGEPAYLDFRVRIRDSNGNWSPWFEVRRKLPTQVVMNPEAQFTLGLGGARQIAATAFDEDGTQVPGDPINWSSYIGSPHATVSPTGTYTVSAASAGGLDWVAARGGYAHGLVAVQGAFVDGSWFSPGWFRPGIDLSKDATIPYMVRVYEGRQYTIKTEEDPNATSSGDIDLYIRFNETATLLLFDDFSADPALVEDIVWTAPADGTLSVLIHAFEAVTGALFRVEGEVIAPRSRESLAVPGAPRPEVGFAPDHREGLGGMLLPPALDERGPPRSPALVAPVTPARSSGGR
jgi:hypothetical protein